MKWINTVLKEIAIALIEKDQALAADDDLGHRILARFGDGRGNHLEKIPSFQRFGLGAEAGRADGIDGDQGAVRIQQHRRVGGRIEQGPQLVVGLPGRTSWIHYRYSPRIAKAVRNTPPLADQSVARRILAEDRRVLRTSRKPW